MNENGKIKRYEELNFTDDFMFCKILQENEDLCKELTELVLNRKIGTISFIILIMLVMLGSCLGITNSE